MKNGEFIYARFIKETEKNFWGGRVEGTSSTGPLSSPPPLPRKSKPEASPPTAPEGGSTWGEWVFKCHKVAIVGSGELKVLI